jgi:hypothetical protein
MADEEIADRGLRRSDRHRPDILIIADETTQGIPDRRRRSPTPALAGAAALQRDRQRSKKTNRPLARLRTVASRAQSLTKATILRTAVQKLLAGDAADDLYC